MSSDNRLKRLRDLLEQFERLPASPERDRMIREVRARVVDVDTGVTPRAMLPVDTAPPVSPTPRAIARIPVVQARRPRSILRPEPVVLLPAPRPEAAPPATGDATAIRSCFPGADALLPVLAPEELLTLDEPAEAHVSPAVQPWRLGLRG